MARIDEFARPPYSRIARIARDSGWTAKHAAWMFNANPSKISNAANRQGFSLRWDRIGRRPIYPVLETPWNG